MSIEIEPEKILALGLFAAQKDVRTYLTNIRVELKKGVMVATDGAVLLAMRQYFPDATGDDFFIPVDVLKNVKIKAGPVYIESGQLRQGGVRYDILQPGAPYYPDWRQAVAKKTDGTAGNFDGDLIARFEKAGKLLGLRPQISQNGEKGAIVTFSDDCFGILMPRRFEQPAPDTAPSWGRY